METIKYIPFLKSKTNEPIALAELDPSIVSRVCPFFDYPRSDKKLTSDSFKKTVTKIVNSLKKHVNEFDEFYFDNYDLDSNFKVDGINNYRFLLNSLVDFNVIPIISIDRSADHVASVFDLKNNGVISSDAVAFRITPEDFEDFDVVKSDIEEQVAGTFNIFSKIDLIFDCRVCLNHDPEKISRNIANFAIKFSSIYTVGRIVVAGSSIPASIRDLLGVGGELIVERVESSIFLKTKKLLGDTRVIFGDYATVSPNYSDLDIIPEMMQEVTAPKLIYSFENKHFIIRGKALKKHGYGQYFDMADRLCSQTFFRGGPYSKGDLYLEEKRNKIGKKCTPSTVVKPLINAHITFMVTDAAI